MPEKNVTNIVLVQLPKNLSCFVGMASIDPAGGQLCAIYDDGSYDMVSMGNPDVSFNFNSDVEGPTLVTATYKGQSVMFQVHVRIPVIRKFQMIQPPKKKMYLVGEKIDLTGIKLQAEYETGEKVPFEQIPAVDYVVKQGDAVYPLSINGITVPIYIKVQDASLVGIRMGKLPQMTEYLERKDSFDVTGATIFKIYNSGVEQEVPIPYSAVRGFSNLTPGPQTLTVQIETFTTTFDITIVEKKAVKVSVDAMPFRTSYTEGEAISMDGVRVSVEYDNGENRICEDWSFEPKVAKLDGGIVTIKVGDAVSQVAITVTPRNLMSIHVSKLPDKIQYRERKDTLDITGAELELQYDYGDPEYIPITQDMAKGFDNRIAGECPVEVQYKGLATTFNVDILPQQLLGITITQMPEKLDYAPGEMFDKKGLVVSGFYDSGILEPLRSYIIEPDRPLLESDVAMLVSSMNKTAVIPIKVAEMFRSKPEQPKAWESEAPVEATQEWDADTPILDMSGGGDKSGPTEPQAAVQETASEPEFGPLPDPSLGFGIPPDPVLDMSQPAPQPMEEPKKKSSFWGGRRLFYPDTSKFRD